MMAGSKALILNLDNIDINEYVDCESLIGTTLRASGRHTVMPMYECYDDDDNNIEETAYEFHYANPHDHNDILAIWLFVDNFKLSKKVKEPPKTEQEWMERVQKNFRE